MRAQPAQVLVIPVCILCVVMHECVRGLVVLWSGDPTGRDRWCLTLNPTPHLSLVGSIVFPSQRLLSHSPVPSGRAKPAPIVVRPCLGLFGLPRGGGAP